LIHQYEIALVSFGNAGKEFLRLLLEKHAELQADYRIEWKLTGLVPQRADAKGRNPADLLKNR
jgi:homoserine dehydrogenase